jgi:hypothetical protein
MPSEFSFGTVRLMSGEMAGVPAAEKRQVIGYSEVASSETPLPIGFNPLSVLGTRTGSLLVGDRLIGHRSEPERLVEGSLRYVRAIASALPIDKDDERIIDELMAKRTAGRTTRPLRRREGEPR